MAATNQQLIAKLTGFVTGLANLTATDRKTQPFIQFAEDYNKTRELTLQLHPDLATIAPQAIQIAGNGAFREASSNYLEIRTYAHQLLALIHDKNNPFTI